MAMNPSGIDPIGGYLVVEPEGGEETTPGGIIVTASTAEKQKYGSQAGKVVAAAGDAKWGLAHAVGKRVAFGRYAGTMLKGADGRDYRLVLDEDVKGIYS